jgi:hypothetical protein
MGNKKTGDAKKNLDQGTSINRQDEQQAQQARDRDDRARPQGDQTGQPKKPNMDQGARH